MNRISQTFQRYKSQNKTAIVPYITPEFPIKGTTIPLVLALEQSGAGMIEIGIPFSDCAHQPGVVAETFRDQRKRRPAEAGTPNLKRFPGSHGAVEFQSGTRFS